MKLQINSKSKPLAFVGAVAKGNSLPILNAVRVSLAEGMAEYQATDLDVTVRVREEATGEDGGTVIDAGLLTGQAKGGAFELNSNCTGAEFVTAGGRSSVATLPLEDWPVTPQFEATVTSGADAAEFHDALEQVAGAQSKDAARFVINSVLLEIGADGLRFVAADGRRLHKVEILARAAQTKPGSVLIPSAAVKQLLRLPRSGHVEIEAGTNRSGHPLFRVTLDGYTVEGKQIDGNFPNWRQVMPEGEQYSYAMESKVFLAALKAVAHVHVKGKDQSVKLTFRGGIVTVSACSPDRGNAEFTFHVNTTADKEWATCFNPVYLAGILEACGPSSRWEFTDELCPVRVTSGNLVAVLMPMRMS